MADKTEQNPPALLEELGSVIAAARTRRRLKQTDVSLFTGIPISTYRRYEKDGPTKVGEAFAIASALGVPLSELIREAEGGPPASATRPVSG
jgi:transcriptional regulator with XRE-family HTH domain